MNVKKKIFFEAIQLKAAIEAYTKVSYKRFCDEIPHAIISILKNDLKIPYLRSQVYNYYHPFFSETF